MIDAGTVFDMLDRLAATQPLRVETVAPITGIDFTRDATQSNVAKLVLVGGPSSNGAFASALLQYPASAAWGTAGLLQLTLAKDVIIAQAAILERYGREARIIAPTASQPPGSPFTLQYMRPSLRISFLLRAAGFEMLSVQFVERGMGE